MTRRQDAASVSGTAPGSARSARETGVPTSVLAWRRHQTRTAGWLRTATGCSSSSSRAITLDVTLVGELRPW